MTNSMFMHFEDKGQLSIFLRDDKVVLMCEHGHFWTVDGGTMTSLKSARSIKKVALNRLPKHVPADIREIVAEHGRSFLDPD